MPYAAVSCHEKVFLNAIDGSSCDRRCLW